MGALLQQFMNKYPYTDFHELNADWLIKTLMEMINQVENFVSLNAIKYADPIQWDIVRQYEKNTVVIDPLTGTAYISVQPVPSGVALTRTEYWTVVFDLGSFVVRAAKNFSNRYEADTTLTATFASSQGDWLVWGDTLYEVIIPTINAGDQYVVNSNIRHITMEEVVDALAQAINDVDTKVGNLDDLTTSDKTSIVNGINSVLTDIGVTIGDLDDLLTTNKDSVVDAINENTTHIANKKIYNVVDFGAVGDGLTDDTSAFTSAFTEAGDAIVYVPEGTYIISSTVNVSCELIMSHGATLKANADVDVLRIRNNGSVHGGKIDVTIANYSHAAILLLGEDKFSPTNSVSKNSIENIHIVGSYKGDGIFLHANLTNAGTSYIQNIRVFNCVIERMSKAIHLKSDVAPDNANATWCNGNIFDMIWIQGAVQGIVTDGEHIPYEAAGNTFSNIQFQTFYYYTHNVVYCNSSLNTFDVFVWDYTLDGGIENYPAFFIYGNSNQIRSNLSTTTAGHYLDRGNNTNIVSYDNYHYYEMSAGAAKKQIVGDQDDFLFAANKRYTVSTTPTISNINNAFSRNAGLVATLTGGTTYEILIDLTADKMVLPRAIGLVFETSTAKNVTIEIYYSGSYHTIYNAVNVVSPLILQTIGGVTNVEYIRISISSSNNQRLSRIFGVDSYKKGMCFVEDFGSTYHGRLAFTDDSSDGIVLKDSDDGFYYLVGVSNGTLTATRI